jgi:hypothetical protein
MASVAAPTQKSNRAYYAHLYETSGVLSKVQGEYVFFGDDDSIQTVEPSMFTWLTVLGEVGLSECQALQDRLHGGAAMIATSRQQEVN